jgi:hypothetical protein
MKIRFSPYIKSWSAFADTDVLIEIMLRLDRRLERILVSTPRHRNWCVAFLRDVVNINARCAKAVEARSHRQP